MDQSKLDKFMGQFVGDLGAAMHGASVVLGERLELYTSLNVPGGLTPAELAHKTGTDERFVAEWLAAQAAAGYVMYAAATGKFHLSPEQAFVLTNEKGPVYLPGAFFVAAANYRDLPRLEAAYRSGKGLGWHERDEHLFTGTSKFFRPNYVANLLPAWLPALDGMVAKLEHGARVADVGCGHGSSTILMAQAYPRSTFFGYDYHSASIDSARSAAAQERAVERVKFETASAQSFPGPEYDLITFFDCLHDMTDPVGAAKHVHQRLKPDGIWMVVEPFANGTLEANLNPVGRVYYSASSMICTPAGRSEPNGAGLGAQASDAALHEVAKKGGFTRFRRVAETPFNRVFEIRR